jgi:GAF domain-containing protein
MAMSMNGLTQSEYATGLGLHIAIAKLVRSVHTESRPHPEDVLERFAMLAIAHIDGVSDAGILLAAHHGVRPSAAGSAISRVLGQLQDQDGEGPGCDAVYRHQKVRVDDLAAEDRWPKFTAAALRQTPVRSLLCYRLYTDVQDWGALSLYGIEPHGLDEQAEAAGEALATHAAVTLQAVQRGRQFRSALGSRDIIGQAKGVLMERYDIGAGPAFELLTRLSQESSKPVVVIAKEVVERRPPHPH